MWLEMVKNLKIEINGSVKIINSFLFSGNILCENMPPIYVTNGSFILKGKKIDFLFKTLIINSDVQKNFKCRL